MQRLGFALSASSFLLLASSTAAAGETQASLSEKQLAVIASKTSGMSPAEKAIVESWSAGKKAAEFLCKELALATLKKHFAGADRVFMEVTNTDRKPTLVRPSLVEGAGTVRYEEGWADFRYECDLDPERGTATGFRFTPETRP